jgi:lysozyme
MDLLSQLRRDEGVHRFPYTDTVGKLTIGVGHNLTDKGLTDSQIAAILADDVTEVQNSLTGISWYVGLDSVRQAVIVNMSFNMGVAGLLAFHKMIGLIELGKYDEAAAEMLNSKWADQVGDRAQRLSRQLATGAWT